MLLTERMARTLAADLRERHALQPFLSREELDAVAVGMMAELWPEASPEELETVGMLAEDYCGIGSLVAQLVAA